MTLILIYIYIYIYIYNDKNKDFKEHIENFGLKQMIKMPTRLTTNTRTIIDHVYISKGIIKNWNIKTDNKDLVITDHHSQFITIEKLSNRKKRNEGQNVEYR